MRGYDGVYVWVRVCLCLCRWVNEGVCVCLCVCLCDFESVSLFIDLSVTVSEFEIVCVSGWVCLGACVKERDHLIFPKILDQFNFGTPSLFWYTSYNSPPLIFVHPSLTWSKYKSSLKNFCARPKNVCVCVWVGMSVCLNVCVCEGRFYYGCVCFVGVCVWLGVSLCVPVCVSVSE